MENKKKLHDLDLFPNNSDITHIINSFKYNNHQNNFLSKHPKKYHKVNKYFSNDHKNFLKNKRRDKNNIRYQIPETPHNTGQYLSHIHREFDSKRKSSNTDKEKDNIGYNEQICCFEEDDEDVESLGNTNFDFQFIEDKKRDRLMSMEGKDLQDFLFKCDKKKEEGLNDTPIKMNIAFDEVEEEDNNFLNLKNVNSSNL